MTRWRAAAGIAAGLVGAALVLAAAAIGLMPGWSRRELRLFRLPVTERTVVRALGHAATGTIRWAMTPA